MGLTQMVILGPLLFGVVQSFQDPQIHLSESFDAIPDCDADFAMHALALVQSKLGDVQRQRDIEAILASCNKPMIQKITEVSIHLLDKGVISTPLIQQLQELSSSRKKEKRFRFAKVASEAPPEYKNIIHKIGSINTNDSLSGNEKLLYIQKTLFQLNPKQRHDLRRILSEPPPITIAPVVSASFPPPLSTIVIPPHPFLPTPSTPITKQEPEKFNFSIPPSFSIGQETDNNLLFSNRKQERELLPARENTGRPSVFIKTVPIGAKELPSRGDGAPSAFGLPISAQITSQGKPVDMKNIDDLDLLNSRSNIWKEVSKFLDKNTNIPSQIRTFLEEHGLRNGVFKGNPQIVAGLSVPANTFPLPAGVAEQLNKAYSGNSQSKRYLPVRQMRDAIIPEVSFKGLDRFDTHLGRFAKGDPNSRAIFAQIPNEQLRPRENVPLRATTLATVTVPTTPPIILEGGAMQVPNRASGFVQFPTYPPPPQVTVHVITTTTKPESGQLPRAGSVDKYPSFPSIDTTAGPRPVENEEFVPYRGPEEITGSRLYPAQPFNQQVGGRPRFVKIDLLNEH